MSSTDAPHDIHAASDDPELVSRRKFLGRLSIALSGIGGALVGVPVVGFLLTPLLRRIPNSWQVVGPVNDFPVGETRQVVLRDDSPLPWAGVAARSAAWLRRDTEQEFVVFAVNCTHLGCPVRWLQDASIFMCPCHGGVFYKDGTVAAGPPPHPLTRYQVRVRNDQVEVLTDEVKVSG